MEANNHSKHSADNSNICRLEWIAWAIDAARRHKEDEQRGVGSTRSHQEFGRRVMRAGLVRE